MRELFLIQAPRDITAMRMLAPFGCQQGAFWGMRVVVETVGLVSSNLTSFPNENSCFFCSVFFSWDLHGSRQFAIQSSETGFHS